MKKYIIGILSFSLIFVLCLSPVAASANDENTNISIKSATLEDIPEGIIPMQFNSEDEFQDYLKNFKITYNYDNLTGANSVGVMSTDDTVTVGSQSAGGATVTLYAAYGTSGDNHRGKITYCNPYTQLSGFTFALTWTQSTIGAEIKSNEKDVYIYTSGVIDVWAILPGGVKIASYPINISRTCYLVW
ncbi:hypothetical protein HNQ56_003076 [Anaerotaenia torta]|uniref:hypothetical protein n=1 Tax=Anaerotaenia torta TaxID=433293 RepID=UPI003D1B7372